MMQAIKSKFVELHEEKQHLRYQGVAQLVWTRVSSLLCEYNWNANIQCDNEIVMWYSVK